MKSPINMKVITMEEIKYDMAIFGFIQIITDDLEPHLTSVEKRYLELLKLIYNDEETSIKISLDDCKEIIQIAQRANEKVNNPSYKESSKTQYVEFSEKTIKNIVMCSCYVGHYEYINMFLDIFFESQDKLTSTELSYIKLLKVIIDSKEDTIETVSDLFELMKIEKRIL